MAHEQSGYGACSWLSGRLVVLLLLLDALHGTKAEQPRKPAAVATLMALMGGTSADFEPQTALCLYVSGVRLATDVLRDYDPGRDIKQVVVADDTVMAASIAALQTMGVNVLQYNYEDKYPFPGYLQSTEVALLRRGPSAMPVIRFDRAMLLKAALWKLEEYAYILFYDLDVFFDSPPKPDSQVKKFVAAAMRPGSDADPKKPLTEFIFHEGIFAPVCAGIFLMVPSQEVYYSLEDVANTGFTLAGGWGCVQEVQLWDEMKNTRCKSQDMFGERRPLVLWERQICETGHTKIWAFASAQCEQGLFHHIFNLQRKSGQAVSKHDFGNFHHFAGGHKPWNLYNFPRHAHNSWMPDGLATHHLRLQGWFWDRLYTQHKDRMFPPPALGDQADAQPAALRNTTATCRAIFDARLQEWKALRQQHNITWVDGWDWPLWPK